SSQMDTKFDVSQLSAQIDKLDLNEENIHVKELKLGPSDSEIFFGKMAASSPELSNEEPSDSTAMNWKVAVDDLIIDQTNVWFRDDNQTRTPGLDYFNMKLNG